MRAAKRAEQKRGRRKEKAASPIERSKGSIFAAIRGLHSIKEGRPPAERTF